MNRSDIQKANLTERKRYVVRPYKEVPLVELLKGSFSHLIWGSNIMVSFLTMKARSVFELHSHPHEQIMHVLEGYCEEVIDNKLYRLEKGDVVILPPNIVHGAFVGEVDCKVIDIFSPVREDYKKMLIERSEQKNVE